MKFSRYKTRKLESKWVEKSGRKSSYSIVGDGIQRDLRLFEHCTELSQEKSSVLGAFRLCLNEVFSSKRTEPFAMPAG